MKVIEAKIVVLGSQGYLHQPFYRPFLDTGFHSHLDTGFHSHIVLYMGIYDLKTTHALTNLVGVGKTSLVVRYIGKMFSKHISPTIGASFFTCNINVEGSRVKLQVWDTAGQERFRSMAPMYYRNANAALLVFDISSVASFTAIKGWVRELQSNVPEPMILSLVGNKCDLESSRTVAYSEAVQYASTIGALYCETSALHDQGIEQVFLSTATALVSSASLMSSLRSYDTIDTPYDRIPTGTPTEEEATHTGKIELPAWSIESIAHGEMQKSMCC